MTQPNFDPPSSSNPYTATPNLEFPYLTQPTPPNSQGRLRKPPSSTHHARSVSAQARPSYEAEHTNPPAVRHSHFDEHLSSPLMAPPPVLQSDVRSNKITKARPDSRPSSREPSRSRPDTPVSNSNPASRTGTPVVRLPWESQSRPTTPNLNEGLAVGGAGAGGRSVSMPSTPALNGHDKKGKSGWFGKDKKERGETSQPLAWIAGHPEMPPYDTTGLMTARPMSEIWDDTDGNCLVYLFPRASGKGPSFKIDSAVFASSPVLTRLAFGEVHSSQGIQNAYDRGARHQLPLEARTNNLSLNDPNAPTTPPLSPRQKRARAANSISPASSLSSNSRGRLSNLSDPPAETHLYLPIKLQDPQNSTQPPPSRGDDNSNPASSDNNVPQDLQTLIDIRNLFAFLTGSSLLATAKKPSLFHIFMTLAAILRTYEFSNLDGSTFGEIASASFDAYVTELRLADVRGSREKTIEGIVLGEKMRSVFLYNEAFTHGAGKYEGLVNLKSPKFSLLSSATDNRLIRAAMDLDKRVSDARIVLMSFDLPTLFTGIMASKTSEVRREGVKFEAWKEGFAGLRKWYLGVLRARYGEWPPKKKHAGSKKGGPVGDSLEGEGVQGMGGLDRVVLREVYRDVCELYDMLVDRTALTSRTADGVDLAAPREDATTRGLRAVLSEYDRSSLPVKPPIPFDLPILPSAQNLHSRTFASSDKDPDANAKVMNRKLQPDELSSLLLQSWNKDSLARPSPLLQSFWENEKRAARGSTLADLVDLRVGYWIFIYVVLQSLPMLVCDAPGLMWTKGVRYFLCMPPRKGVPWANPNEGAATMSGAAGVGGCAGTRKTWFAVGDEGDVVCLPADAVEHGVEGVFKRSHCWVVAEKWTRGSFALDPPPTMLLDQGIATPGISRPPSISYSDSPGVAGTPPPWGTPPLLPSHSGLLAAPDSRPGSRASYQNKRNSSLTLGLEALPLPPGISPDGSGTPPPGPPGSAGASGASGYQSSAGQMEWERPRSAAQAQARQTAREHAVDASRTFDAILKQVEAGKEGKKGRRSWRG